MRSRSKVAQASQPRPVVGCGPDLDVPSVDPRRGAPVEGTRRHRGTRHNAPSPTAPSLAATGDAEVLGRRAARLAHLAERDPRS